MADWLKQGFTLSDKPIEVGDFVIPWDVLDEECEHRGWTPCRVVGVYKNGNLYAKSEDGSNVSWRGQVSGFRVVVKP